VSAVTQRNMGATFSSTQARSSEGIREKNGDATQGTEMDPSVSWIVWPLSQSFWRSAAVILFLIVVVWTISSWLGITWAFLSSLILLGSLASFFFPTHYRLSPESVSVRGLLSRKKRNWSGLKKHYVGQKGVHLSPYPRPSRLESFRGLYLPFDGKREEILNFIGEKMDCGC
jgi:hypothetical protein